MQKPVFRLILALALSVTGTQAFAVESTVATASPSAEIRAKAVEDFKAHGFTVVILYDKASEKVARKLKHAFEFQKPFSRLHGWFHVKKELVANEMLKCHDAGMEDARVVVCDNQKELLDFGRRFGADHVLVLTSKGVGGSGGLVAVFSTSGDRYRVGEWQKGFYRSGDRVIQGSMHEFLHQVGFVDEYSYDEPSFQKTYCVPGTLENKTNVIYQDFSKLRFKSEDEARAYLNDKIPWLHLIPRSVSVLTGSEVGTQEYIYKRGTLGLFRGGGCNSVTQGWVPYEVTLMEELWGPLSKLMPPYFVQEVREALIKDAYNASVERVTSTKDDGLHDEKSAE